MIKRLLNYSPKEMHQLTSEELFYAMKMDEGRTVEGLANCAAPNYLEDTSNAEVCAAFGCDMAFTGKTPEGRTVTLYGLEWHNESRKTVTEVECILHPDCGTQLVLGCVNGIFIQN